MLAWVQEGNGADVVATNLQKKTRHAGETEGRMTAQVSGEDLSAVRNPQVTNVSTGQKRKNHHSGTKCLCIWWVTPSDICLSKHHCDVQRERNTASGENNNMNSSETGPRSHTRDETTWKTNRESRLHSGTKCVCIWPEAIRHMLVKASSCKTD